MNKEAAENAALNLGGDVADDYAKNRAAIDEGVKTYRLKVHSLGGETFEARMRALEAAINAGIEAARRADADRQRLRQIDG